jgi:hypothetical protein
MPDAAARPEANAARSALAHAVLTAQKIIAASMMRDQASSPRAMPTVHRAERS